MICFHNPDEENGYLSNWYLSDFCDGSIVFSSMEQYMMFQKAVLFNDVQVAKKILSTMDVRKIKELGRSVHNFNDEIWDRYKEDIVIRGLYMKFSQNADLRYMLLATGTDIIAECAVHDKIWGIGLSMSDPNRFNINKWRGQNLLGKALMVVRETLM